MGTPVGPKDTSTEGVTGKKETEFGDDAIAQEEEREQVGSRSSLRLFSLFDSARVSFLSHALQLLCYTTLQCWKRGPSSTVLVLSRSDCASSLP